MTPLHPPIAALARRIAALDRREKAILLLSHDTAAAGLALAATHALHPLPTSALSALAPALAPLVAVAAAGLGLHRVTLSADGADRILRSAALAGLSAAALHALAPLAGAALPGLASILFALLFLVGALAGRAALRHLALALLRHGQPSEAVVLYGAGETGVQLAAALRHHRTLRPVAFLDDNPALHGLMLAGLRVHGASCLPALMARHRLSRVILALPSLPAAHQARLARPIHRLGLAVQAVPSFAELVGGGSLVDRLTPLQPDRFLHRAPVAPALGSCAAAYRGRSILVTGAGGSIGGELCRALLACRPARLVLLDLSEAALYAIDKDLRPLAGTTDILPVIGSVTDARALRALFARHAIDIVFHAAAYKHVPLVEANPAAGVENNVFGTRTLAEESLAAGVARFILVSSDKAVRPGNVMGATKRLAELAVQDLGTRTRTTGFAIVRFGNVLGSSGSVVPLFREQIARGGPLTLTHPEVTRYFMTLAEAAGLVLAAGALADTPETGADVFVLDMGPPVRIRDLAHRMIAAAGLRPRDADHPDGDIDIVLTGLRPGEKLHEELLIGQRLLPTPHPRILRAAEASLSQFEMAMALSRLRAALAARDEAALRQALFAAVETGGRRDAPATPGAPIRRPLALPH